MITKFNYKDHTIKSYAIRKLTPRGCPNKCPWCVVPRKEGGIHAYWDIERVACGRKNVVLMDNNILAAGDYAHEQLRKIAHLGYRIDFNQALDARLATEEFARELAQCKWINRIRFGCDTDAQIIDCERAMDMITGYGYRGEYFLYTMIGGNEEATKVSTIGTGDYSSRTTIASSTGRNRLTCTERN